MNCPKCGGQTDVFDSRKRDNGTVWRRRECIECGEIFTTYELPKEMFRELQTAQVIKDKVKEFVNGHNK